MKKSMEKSMSAIALSLMLVTTSVPATSAIAASATGVAAGETYRITMNGKELNTSRGPINREGSLLVPLRAIFEALGADVTYDPSSQTIEGIRGGTTVQLRVGSVNALRNGEPMTLAQPPALVDGSAFVPIRFIVESLGADVAWDAESREVRIRARTTAASLEANERLPLLNDKDEPITLLHGGDIALSWWFQDESPYQQWDAYVVPDDRIVAIGFDEVLVFDRRTGEVLDEYAWADQDAYYAAEAIREGEGYRVTLAEGDRSSTWQGIPIQVGMNSKSIIKVEGELSPDFLRLTAALDREGHLIVPTTDGLAAYDAKGERIWLHKEWRTPEGVLDADGPIETIASDASNRLYISYADAFVVLEADGSLLTAIPQRFLPKVLEDGTLAEGGAAYRIEDGELVPLGALWLGNRQLFSPDDGDGTVERVNPETGETIWSYRLSADESGRGYTFFDHTYVVDGADHLYLPTTGGSVHSLDAHGNLRFVLTVNNRTISLANVVPLSASEFLVVEGNKIMCFALRNE
ncbi:stalk domain-containing protein [Paenibacillus sp. TRM 82003]|nr:stalk domain-containing protein [Paenibacillus sp. TRM 82003]